MRSRRIIQRCPTRMVEEQAVCPFHFVYNGCVTTTMLQTKLYVPPLRPGDVARDALIQRLDGGFQRGCSLTLISAPAGYGKTSIMVQWLKLVGLPVAWLSLDENDNEPARFAEYLVAALQTVDPAIGSSISQRLQAPKIPALSALMTALINDITAIRGTMAGAAPEILLVLDDYQTISSPEIHAAVDFLLAQQTPGLHLAILTRQDPPLSLSRLRGRGLLSELRQADLRFTTEEATKFLRSSMGVYPAPEEIASLNESTEGWITGLQLAALSMQGLDADQRGQFIDNFSGKHHFILDYLTDEVLKRQPSQRQTFLLRTSILDQMCAPLCQAVLGEELPGQDLDPVLVQNILIEMDHDNLFLVPMDDERLWYRYHHLFAELLRARLHEKWPDQLPGLHQRAAAWYEENGFMDLAVGHAMQVGDPEYAAAVVERAVRSFSTWSKVEIVTLLAWLEAIPQLVWESRPWLRLFAARAYYLTGQPERSKQVQESLARWLEANPDAPSAEPIAGLVRADRASYAVVSGDVRQSIRYAESAIEHLPAEDATSRMRAYAILGLAHSRAGSIESGRQAFMKAIDSARALGIPLATVPLLCNLAEIHIMAGKLGDASRASRQALESGAVDERPLAVNGFAYLQLGKILYQRNQLSDAESHLTTALGLIGQGGITESFGNIHAELALVKQAQGQEEEARSLVQQGVSIARQGNIQRLLTLALAYQARIWLSQGNLNKATKWARDYRRHQPTQYLRDFEDLTLARIMLAAGEAASAKALLDGMLVAADSAGRYGRVIEITAILALVADAGSDSNSALRFLARSLELAEAEGYIRVYLDEGPPMVALLNQAVRQGILPEYATRLLLAFEQETTSTGPGQEEASRSPAALLVEPITKREMEVLQLISEGLTNREIARQLVLSPNTIRTHTYNLYGKLGVHSRLQAVTRARELNLLDSS